METLECICCVRSKKSVKSQCKIYTRFGRLNIEKKIKTGFFQTWNFKNRGDEKSQSYCPLVYRERRTPEYFRAEKKLWGSLVQRCGSAGKESACSVWELDSIPGLGRSPGEGKRLPTSVLWPREFRGLYVHGVTNSQTGLSDFHFLTLGDLWNA